MRSTVLRSVAEYFFLAHESTLFMLKQASQKNFELIRQVNFEA